MALDLGSTKLTASHLGSTNFIARGYQRDTCKSHFLPTTIYRTIGIWIPSYHILCCQGASCDQVSKSTSTQWWRCLRPLTLSWFLVAASSHSGSSNSNRDRHGTWEMMSVSPVWFREQVGGRWCQDHASYESWWLHFPTSEIVFLFHSSVHSG